ncbi:MAG: DNA repair exonuclease [Geminicoccaceae bacterium]
MSLRLLHTADWQLGKPFHHLPPETAPLLREARFEAVRRIAELATANEVAAVLVAGDVFDGNLVPEKTIIQALAAMRGFAGPWILLPGNHDAALAEGVWARLERLGRPGNVLVAATATPISLADGRLVVLPAPLTERHTSDDLTAWMDAVESPSDTFRVGLAHGSVAGRLPEAADFPNPIDGERARKARLDYLALGDWHGTLEIAERTWYAGTPEPDRFRSRDAGNVLLVELDRPGARPAVTKLPTLRHRWHQLTLDLTAVGDPNQALDQLFAEVAPRERAIVELTLEGVIDLSGRAELEPVLARWAGEVCHLEVCDDLLAAPSERDLDRLGSSPAVGTVASDLADKAKAGDPVAALALRLLYVEHTRAGGAG